MYVDRDTQCKPVKMKANNIEVYMYEYIRSSVFKETVGQAIILILTLKR